MCFCDTLTLDLEFEFDQLADLLYDTHCIIAMYLMYWIDLMYIIYFVHFVYCIYFIDLITHNNRRRWRKLRCSFGLIFLVCLAVDK